MVRGEIYFADLAPRSGSEQTGRRPCVIVLTDAFNSVASWRSITVVPLTTAERWLETSPTTIQLEAGDANLSKRCAGLAHQVTTIDKGKLLGNALGILSEPQMRQLNRALENYLGLA